MNFLRRIFTKSDVFQPVKAFSTLNRCLEKSSFICSQNVKSVPFQSEPLQNLNLNAVSTSLNQIREYKVKTRLRKRCKSCFFVWRNGRLYVECKEHPRHKQHHKDSMLKGYDNIPHGFHVPNI